jgi:hypothetical protein
VVAPLACAAANLVAVVVLALALAPGTPVTSDLTTRERYIREHLLVWQLGWATWMVAAATLIWCYVWWRRRVAGPHLAVTIALVGIAADWSAEIALIVSGADGYASIAPLAFFMTGAIANGLYTVAGILLSLATPLGPAGRMYAALMWAAGAVLSFAAAVAFHLLTAAATALLFAMFIPWCIWLWRRFA